MYNTGSMFTGSTRADMPPRPLRRVGFVVLRALLYVVICFFFLTPFIWMFFGGLRGEREIFPYLYPLAGARFSHRMDA